MSWSTDLTTYIDEVDIGFGVSDNKLKSVREIFRPRACLEKLEQSLLESVDNFSQSARQNDPNKMSLIVQ